MNTTSCLKTKSPRPSAVAVGFFDGVHKGHQAVIRAALARRAEDLEVCVFSFSTARSAPEAKRGAGLLQTPSLKRKSIGEMGVDCLLIPDFTRLMDLSPEEFVRSLLYEALQARVVCCGEDYRFGKGAAAGPAELGALLAPLGVEVVVVGAALDGGLPVSSTRVRAALANGDPETARRLLGRPFAIDFPVAAGKALGRKLGFPTANQPFLPGYALPKFGVYATEVLVGGRAHPAVTNVGLRPTVGSDGVIAESYLPGWSGNLYGKRIETRFLRYLRPERRFDSLEALSAAIECDAQQTVFLHQSGHFTEFPLQTVAK